MCVTARGQLCADSPLFNTIYMVAKDLTQVIRIAQQVPLPAEHLTGSSKVS